MRKEFPTDRDDLFVVHDFLTASECRQHIERSEAAGYGDAPITTIGGPVMLKEVRNNDRVMIDDAPLERSLWERLQPLVPEREGSWTPVGLNERFRFYRYDPGQQFNWHYDGRFERSPLECSIYTFMIYLNGGFTGGATEFNLHGYWGEDREQLVRVQPEAGKALMFIHRVLHRGAPVEDGRKYVLRSDAMARWIGEGEAPL
jgi:predicted 2-oxoglutarate/Fe(II)-dependent dioxygenase YbiX